MSRIIITTLLLLWALLTSAQSTDTLRWRSVFTDAQLVGLIDTALVHNADVRTAALNVEQASATLKAAKLAFLPSLTIGAEGSISKTKNSDAAKTYNIPATMQWEVDLAGRLRGEKRTAVANYWSATETERSIELQVITTVATGYYTLIMLDRQLEVTRQNLQNAKHTVEVMEAMKDAGMQSEVAVSQARAALLNIAASEKSLLQQIHSAQNALSVILGKQQEHLELSTTNTDTINISHTTSYELSMLANRPDVKAAEYALKAQMAQVDVARSAFYPSLNITASMGWTNNLGQIVNPGQMLLNLVGTLVQPLFNKGQNRANLRIAKAQQEQALVAFNQSLLVAGTELSDALTACSLCHERMQLRQQEVASAQHAYDVSRDLMQHSSTTYLEVLTAQQAALQSSLALITDEFEYVQAKINLFKAIGGN